MPRSRNTFHTRPPVNTSAQVISYFLLAFFITWLLWLPSLLRSAGVQFPDPLLIFGQLATLGPLVAALLVTGCVHGKAGVVRLFRSAWNWKFNKIWLLAIFGMPLAVTGLSLLIKLALEHAPFQPGVAPASLPVVALMIFFAGGALEEFGWRGFALPLMLRRSSPAFAALILGVLHALWHLPLHFIEGTVQSAMPFWQFTAATVVGSLVYVWIFLGTSASLTAMILYHWISNLCSAVFVYWDTGLGRWIFFGLQLLIVVVLLLSYKNLLKTLHVKKNQILDDSVADDYTDRL